MAATFDFTNGASLPAGATLARAAGPWSRRAASGLIELGTAANTPRFEHDLAGARLGVLVEPQRKNMLARSSEMVSPDWTIFESTATLTVVQNFGAGPDGTASAERFSAGAFNAGGYAAIYAAQQVIVDAILSVFMRGQVGGEQLYLLIQGQPNGPRIQLTDAYQRFTYTRPGSSDYFGWGTHAGRPGSEPTAACKYFAWGAQVEVQGSGERPGPSSYIPTAATAATRPGETLTLAWGAQGVPDGAQTFRYTFDDGSTQDLVQAVSGGSAAVPTNLARPVLRSAVHVPGLVTPAGRTAPVLFDAAPRIAPLN